MMSAVAVLLLASMWRWTTTGAWAVLFSVCLLVAIAAVAVYCWRMDRTFGRVLSWAYLVLAGITYFVFYCLIAAGDGRTTWALIAQEALFFALLPIILLLIVLLALGNSDCRRGVVVGGLTGFALGRAAVLVLPCAQDIGQPVYTAIWASVIAGAMIGLDIGRYADRHPEFWRNRMLWVSVCVIAGLGSGFRVYDVVSGDYRTYTVDEIAAIGRLDVLARKIGTSTDPSDRCYAIREVGENGGPEMTGILIRRLRDPDTEVRALAAKYLRYYPSSSAVPPLIDALQDESEMVREEAVYTLCQLRDPRSLPAFIRLLESDDYGLWIPVARQAYALGARDEVVRILTRQTSDPRADACSVAERLLREYSR